MTGSKRRIRPSIVGPMERASVLPSSDLCSRPVGDAQNKDISYTSYSEFYRNHKVLEQLLSKKNEQMLLLDSDTSLAVESGSRRSWFDLSSITQSCSQSSSSYETADQNKQGKKPEQTALEKNTKDRCLRFSVKSADGGLTRSRDSGQGRHSLGSFNVENFKFDQLQRNSVVVSLTHLLSIQSMLS